MDYVSIAAVCLPQSAARNSSAYSASLPLVRFSTNELPLNLPGNARDIRNALVSCVQASSNETARSLL